MNTTAQKLFAFFIRSDTNEGMVALKKLSTLGVTLDDVAMSIGVGKWKTRYGNIEFHVHPPYIHHGLGCENPDHSGWCTKNPQTCKMIVLESGTTRQRMTHDGQLCNHPAGTCMIMPPDMCWYA